MWVIEQNLHMQKAIFHPKNTLLTGYEFAKRRFAAISKSFDLSLLLEIIMPTMQSATTRKSTARGTTTRGSKNDAIKLLVADHAKVKKMFKEFEKLCKKNDDEGKEELATEICKELSIHAQLEEEIFYPAAREAIDDEDLMNEAMVEHASAKDLIAQIQSINVSDPIYVALVTVLGEYVNHHIAEEQNEIFPRAQKSKMDLEEIGSEIAERKKVLMGE
jgi:hemerythrin-like domain-containing protein